MMKLVLTLALSAIAGDVTPSTLPTSTASNLAFNTEFYDRSRERRIPVAIYGATGTPKPLAIISPGWDEPYRSAHTAYGFMAEYLVRQGFVVAAIQHQLPSDPTPPSVGNLAVLRRPYWEAGVANILHVDGVLRGLGVVDTSKAAVLVGHSHGGDISMLLATLHPEFADAVLTSTTAGWRYHEPRGRASARCARPSPRPRSIPWRVP